MESLKKTQSEETSKSNAGQKNANVLDGVNKAEARAKRKEAKKQNKGKKGNEAKETHSETAKPQVLTKEKKESDNSKNVQENTTQCNSAPKTTVNSNKLADNLTKTNNSPKQINNSPKPADDGSEKSTKPQNEGLSKAELKAQRRAVQEAQRQAKAGEKTVKTEVAKPESESNENQSNQITDNTESKAELRAKRRAIQEAQRLAKAKEQAEKIKSQPQPQTDKILPVKIVKRTPRKESISIVTGGNFQKQVQLFNHLYLHHSTSLTKELTPVAGLHSSVIRLGAQYLSHNVLGSNSRCLALLSAIKNLITDYKTPPHQEFCRSLESNLQASTKYLQKCRPLAVSMTNAVRNIKWQLTQMETNLSDDEKKTRLLEAIDTYIRDEIGMAGKQISLTVQKKIKKGDVILTYGCSSVVMKIILDAHKDKKDFKVVVVDSRPLLEGREMLRKLVNAGINCSYVLINSVSFIMGKVSLVLLGAHSLLANGYVMSRAGTAQVALIAQSYNKPVLVCCETYKFCERVQTDSIVHNEIGDPDKLVSADVFDGKSPLANWKESRYVTPLNLMYDVTPPDLVTAVVTELAILPCTSVPVILRIKPTELVL